MPFLSSSLPLNTWLKAFLPVMQRKGYPKSRSSSCGFMLIQSLPNSSSRHLLSCKRPHFLTQGLWRGCTIHWIHAGKISVLSVFVVTSRWDPARSSIWVFWKHIDFIFFRQWWDLGRFEQQYSDTINRNLDKLQFDLCQSHTRAGKHFFFVLEASRQISTRQQCWNAISVWELCYTTSLFQHIIGVATTG